MSEPLPGVARPMRAVLLWGSVASVIALPLAAMIGYAVDAVPGAWGGFLGVLIPVAFFSGTVIVALLTLRVPQQVFGAVVLGSWLVKIVLLLVALFFLRDATFFNRPVFFFAFLIGTAGYLILEAMIVVKTRVPYVEIPPIR